MKYLFPSLSQFLKIALLLSVVSTSFWPAFGQEEGLQQAEEQLLMISFTTKGQDFKTEVLPIFLQVLAENPGATVVTGFATREFLMGIKKPTDVIDALDAHASGHILWVDQNKGVATAESRNEMADLAEQTNAKVVVIGDPSASGVAEEIKAYEDRGVQIEYRKTHKPREFIHISFTTAGQDFKTEVLPEILRIAAENPNATLVEGFASRPFLEGRGIDTEVLDAFDAHFSGRRISIVNAQGVAGPDERDELARRAAETGAKVFILGDQTASGVAEEIKRYQSAGADLTFRPLRRNKEFVHISFTTKNQDFRGEVLPELEKIANRHPEATVVTGFASIPFLNKISASTEVIDTLNRLFPGRHTQIVGRRGTAVERERTMMAEMAAQTRATVYVLGDEEASGVKEEAIGYRAKSVEVHIVPLRRARAAVGGCRFFGG